MSIALKLISPKEATKPSRKTKERIKEKLAFVEGEEPASVPQADVGVGANRRILVVDDNEVVLKAFELKLKSSGFIVHTTSNAASVASMVESEKSELIILDIDFPPGGAMDWNGFTILQWVRHFPELARIPVIFVTGSDLLKYKDRALASGAAGFFEKPVDFKALLDQILSALNPTSEATDLPRQNPSDGAN